MSDSDISFSGRTVTVAGHTWPAPWPVRQAAVIDGRAILIYDYMAGPRHRQFQNHEAFSFSGQKLWTVEHPSSQIADSHVEFTNLSPLVVWNFACHRCTVYPASGRLSESQFMK